MLLLNMSCKIMCWKLADLPVCLVFIRSLSPWYFSSLSENKTGDTRSQANLERRAVTVAYSNTIWWPRHNSERLMICQRSRLASWEAPGTPRCSPCSHLAPARAPLSPGRTSIADGGSAAGSQSLTPLHRLHPRPSRLPPAVTNTAGTESEAKPWALVGNGRVAAVSRARRCTGKLKQQAVCRAGVREHPTCRSRAPLATAGAELKRF